ncbi:MAG: hypothetical protein ACI3V5_00735 [Faecousia sp.]
MTLRELTPGELSVTLFKDFRRHQQVTKCWRKVDGRWTLIDNPFVEDWTQAEYAFLVECLKGTLSGGGAVYGAFDNGVLKGFASVEAEPFGSRKQYRELTSIHVSDTIS